jgi:hypothetical protein
MKIGLHAIAHTRSSLAQDGELVLPVRRLKVDAGIILVRTVEGGGKCHKRRV